MAGNVRKRGKVYEVTYYADGKRRWKTYARKLDADNFLTTTQADQLRGDWIDPRDGRVTVREYGERWFATLDIRPTTRDRYRNALDHHVYKTLGGVNLSSLTKPKVKEWQSGLLTCLAPSTAAVIRCIFAAMLKSAVEDRVLTRTPFTGIRAPKVSRKLVIPLPNETVWSIEDGIYERYSAAVTVGAGCGLRRGEVFALKVGRVDFLRKTLTVDPLTGGLVQTKAGVEFGPPKTASSVRKVPMPETVVAALAAHVAKFPPVDGLIFTTSRGNPVGRSVFMSAWRHSGAPAGSRFHDLRHYYASTLIEFGESVKVVQARLGHASAMETLDTYGHLFPDNEDKTRKALDAALTRPVVTRTDEVASPRS